MGLPVMSSVSQSLGSNRRETGKEASLYKIIASVESKISMHSCP
jgi:hypothetical protein